MKPRPSLPSALLAAFLTLSPAFEAASHSALSGSQQRRTQERAPEEGSVALAGTWSTQGGPPARTGVSFSEPVIDDPVEAWSHGPANYEGEPVLWGRLVVAAARDSKTRRTVLAFDLESGSLLFHQRLKATVPLELSLWEDLLAARATETRAELYRIRGSRMSSVRSFQNDKGVSAPLLFEDEIYVREGEDLVAYTARQREPRWRARVEGTFRGTPALRGGHVYAGWYDIAGNLHVAVYERRSGKRVADTRAGHHGRKHIPHEAQLGFSVHAADVFVKYPYPAQSTDHQSFAFGRVARRGGGSAALHPFGTTPTAFGPGWIVKEMLGKRGARWITALKEPEGLSARVLSDAQNQPWLTAYDQPSSRVGDIAYLGGAAVSLSDYSVKWRRGTKLTERPVPANGLVLWVEGKNLRAMRSGSAEPSSTQMEAARMLADIDARLGADLAALAAKSVRVGDLERTERLLLEARRLGASERKLEKSQKQLETLARASRPPKTSRSKVRALDKQERKLRERPTAKLLDMARTTYDRNAALSRELMRRLLERDPKSTEAQRTIRAWVPDDFPRSRHPDPLSWLDFLDVHDRNSVGFIDAPTSKKNLPADQEALRLELGRWRRDIGGYRSERLLVITPPGRPGAVARSLEVGELVCDLLEGLFGASGSRSNAAPLTMLLYETRAEYIRQSRREKSGPEIGLGWTAGHYSTGENLSRMFVPEEDSQYGELLGVYAHELTHHWLEARSPMAFDVNTGGRSLEQPGYWIGEGFATLIEEFLLDPKRGTWKAENARASSLDTLANATDGQLLSWDFVLKASYTEFTSLRAENDRTIPVTWKLGVRSKRSQIQMFYAQSGAVCHYLFNADGGRYRSALINYVGGWYRGDRSQLDPQRAFGLSAKKLGKRARTYAKATIERAISD